MCVIRQGLIPVGTEIRYHYNNNHSDYIQKLNEDSKLAYKLYSSLDIAVNITAIHRY